MKYWYLLRSKPNKEEMLWNELLARNIEVYYPRIRVKVVNPRARKLRSFFPGYIFVSVDPSDLQTLADLRWLPGAHGLVTFGDEPGIVPEGIVNGIRTKVDRLNVLGVDPERDLEPGDSVKIIDGPFAGYEGIFDTRISGSERVRILLNLVEKQHRVLTLPDKFIHKQKRS